MRVTFVSNRPIDRWFGKLTFRVDEKAIRGERQRAGVVSFLKDHDRTKPIGRLTSAHTIVGGARRKRADINVETIDTPTAVETQYEIDQKVRNGISFGYDIYELEVITEADYSRGVEAHYEATSWDYWEISSVTVPANMDAKIRGRADAGSDDIILSGMAGYAAFDTTADIPEDDGAQFILGMPYTEMSRTTEVALLAAAHERFNQRKMEQGTASTDGDSTDTDDSGEEQGQEYLDESGADGDGTEEPSNTDNDDGAEGTAQEGNPAEPPPGKTADPVRGNPAEEDKWDTEEPTEHGDTGTETESGTESGTQTGEGTETGTDAESGDAGTESSDGDGTETGEPGTDADSTSKTGDDDMPDEPGKTTNTEPEGSTTVNASDVARIMELAEFGNTEIHKQEAYNAIRDKLSLDQYKENVKEALKTISFQDGTIAGKARSQAQTGDKYDLQGVADYLLATGKGKTAQRDIAYAITMSDRLFQSGMVEVNGEMRNLGMPNREQVNGFMQGGGLVIPHAAMSGEATLVASTNVSGEIAIEVDEARYLDWLVEPSRILRFTDVIRDVTSDFRIPVGSGSGPQVGYVAENSASITDTAATWRTVAPEPHALVGTMDYTELSNIRTGGFVSRRLGEGFGAALAAMVDNSIISGSGSGAAPAGLAAAATTTTKEENKVNLVGIASGGITWAKIVEIEGAVKRNGPFGNYIYVPVNTIYSAMRTTPRATGQGGFIINDVNVELKTGAIDGTPVIMSDHVAAKTIWYGPFDQCVVPFWGFVVTGNFREPANPLRNRIFILQYHDVVFRRLDLYAKGLQA